jgi:hypothetical protein
MDIFFSKLPLHRSYPLYTSWLTPEGSAAGAVPPLTYAVLITCEAPAVPPVRLQPGVRLRRRRFDGSVQEQVSWGVPFGGRDHGDGLDLYNEKDYP